MARLLASGSSSPMGFVTLLLLAIAALRCAVAAADEPRDPWTTSRLYGTPTPPPPFKVAAAFPGLKFDHPTSLHEIPDSGRMLITEIGGRVLTFLKDSSVTEADLAINLQNTAGGNVSLFAAVLHPQFSTNRFIYLCLVHPQGGSHTRVSRFVMTNDPVPTIDPDSETVIITWPSGGHNAGCLRFGTDGLLYIATGDGSGPNPPDGLTTGQDISDLLGCILRINVDQPSTGKNYSIPEDNPFVDLPEARPEIFGYGLRNPWKFGIDRRTNEVFVADNGWETWEMIHLVGSGTNCGWPIMEGRVRLRTEVAPGPTPITPPIRDHHHSEANSVIGGPIYRGAKLKSLDGQFIYGDYITGTIWSVGRSAEGAFTGQTLVDTDLRITDFLEGSAGELFVVDYDFTGQIYELLPNDAEDLSASFPRMLSQTGLFESVTPLRPAAGVIPYSVIVPRWTDGAVARRFVAIPGREMINLAPNAELHGEFPEGTVFVKHLSIPTASAESGSAESGQPLETQILHFSNGVWNPYSYLWNTNGSDAELVSSIGTATSVLWPETSHAEPFTERTWRTSSVNECRLCHNAGPGFVLGFVGNQLALSGEAGHRKNPRDSNAIADQLDYLKAKQVISEIPQQARSANHQLVDVQNESLDLNDRARSYLHGNCSMCHHRGGNAIVSFFLSRDLPFDRMNTDKGTGIGTFGMQNAKIIAPGDPYRSVLMYRMSKLGYARMPYIGSQVVDSDGIALIDQWIRSLPPDPTARPSEPLIAGSAQSSALAELANRDTAANVRRRAIQNLTTTAEGSLALVAQLHAGNLLPDDSAAAVENVRDASSDLRGLFDHFIPESQRKKTLGTTFDHSLVLSVSGDALRGRLIFFSDAARCRTCHHADKSDLSVGPTLTEVSRKYSELTELLLHVAEPSRKVDEKFAAWTVVTNDGLILSGLMEEQNDQQIILRTTERGRVTILRQQLDELQRNTRSLMPDGLLADLTAQEAADLLAFIRSLAEPTTETGDVPDSKH